MYVYRISDELRQFPDVYQYQNQVLWQVMVNDCKHQVQYYS